MFMEKVMGYIRDNNWIKYTLALLHVSRDKTIHGSLRLHKILFMVSRGVPELLEDDSYSPHEFGPFSEDVEESVIGFLEMENLIDVKHPDNSIVEYKLTPDGAHIARRVFDDMSSGGRDNIKRVYDLFDGLTSDEILFIVYFMYPETSKYSRVVEKIRSNKLRLARSIYKKKGLSSEFLSQISNLNESDITND